MCPEFKKFQGALLQLVLNAKRESVGLRCLFLVQTHDKVSS